MWKKKLQGRRVAILAADGFEQVELTIPKKVLERNGAAVEILSLKPGSVRGMNLLYPGKKVEVDRTLVGADIDEYDALVLPGGYINPDTLRQSERALRFVSDFDGAGKPIAAICHAPWIFISAGIIKGRSLTSWPGIRDDVRNGGGEWKDAPAVRDGNWVTSRGPQDIAAFCRAMIELFAEQPAREEPEEQSRRRRGIAGPLLVSLAGIGAATYLANERRKKKRATPFQRFMSSIRK